MVLARGHRFKREQNESEVKNRDLNSVLQASHITKRQNQMTKKKFPTYSLKARPLSVLETFGSYEIWYLKLNLCWQSQLTASCLVSFTRLFYARTLKGYETRFENVSNNFI